MSDCMGACQYCNLTQPSKCIANSSLIIPCDEGYAFNKTISSCVLRPLFQSSFTDFQFTNQRMNSIQQKQSTLWRQGKVQQCSYKNSKGITKYFDVIGLFKQVQGISKQFQVSQHHETYYFSFNLLGNRWMLHNDFLIIDIESNGSKLSSYEISYESRQSFEGKNVISCQNQTLITQKFNIKINTNAFKNTKIKITFTGFLLTSIWGITNINFIPGCQKFSIYNKLTGGCDFCDMGYFPINERMSIISKNQLIRCQKCAFQCNHCMNQTFCYSCIKGYKLVSFKCVPDDEFAKVQILETKTSNIKTCQVANFSFFTNQVNNSIQTVNISQISKKKFGNSFMIFDFVYNTKFRVNSGRIQVKVNNIKISQISLNNLTNKGFEACLESSTQRYSIQKFNLFVPNVTESVNLTLKMIDNCQECRFGFSKLTFVYTEDKSVGQIADELNVITTNKLDIASADGNSVITTSTTTATTITSMTSQLSIVNQSNKLQQTILKPLQIDSNSITVVNLENALQKKNITQNITTQKSFQQSSNSIVSISQNTTKEIQPSEEIVVDKNQISAIEDQKMEKPQIISADQTMQQTINNKTNTFAQESKIIDSVLSNQASQQTNQNSRLQQQSNINSQKQNKTQIVTQQSIQPNQSSNSSTQVSQSQSSSAQISQPSEPIYNNQSIAINSLPTNGTLDLKVDDTLSFIKGTQTQHFKKNDNSSIPNSKSLQYNNFDVLAFSLNGNNGLIIKLNKTSIPKDLNHTKIYMELSSTDKDNLGTSQQQHILYRSTSHMTTDLSYSMMSSIRPDEQTAFAFYTDKTYLKDKVTIYSMKDSVKTQLTAFSIQRTDFLDSKTQNILLFFNQFFSSIAWFLMIIAFVTMLTAKMYLIQETLQLIQFIFFSVYIFTSYLPGSIINTISGLRRVQNLDFLPQALILSIQEFLLGDLVQQSPLRLTLFHKDINFIRGIISIVFILLISGIWFLLIFLYDKKTRKQGQQQDEDGIYGDYIAENNISYFGAQNLFEWFHIEVVRKIARNKLNYWTQVLKIIYLSIVFLAFKQFNNFRNPQGHNGQIFNIILCLIILIGTIGLLITCISFSSKKYYKLEYGNFINSYPAIYYKKIPKNCLPTKHHLFYNPFLKEFKPIIFCLIVAIAGNHPLPIFILMLIINVAQILFAWTHDIYQDSLYFKFLIVESTIFTGMLLILMIISCISSVISTEGYLAFGYIFMTFSIVVVINGIVRSGYLIADYVQKQMEGKEKTVQSSRIV